MTVAVRLLTVLAFAAALLSAAPAHTEDAATPEPAVPPAATDPLPAGTYKIDRAHTSLLFRVSHLGFSNYTARFKHVEATLELDPANPSAARLEAKIDPKSLETDYPDPATLDFNAQLTGPEWLDAAKYPEITLRSTAIELTGENTANITADLSLHGVTKPITLVATFNGGYAGHPFDRAARIGFSAHGSFKRSDFGIAYGIPAPGTTMGVSDDVEVIIETEFSGPAWTPPAQ